MGSPSANQRRSMVCPQVQKHSLYPTPALSRLSAKISGFLTHFFFSIYISFVCYLLRRLLIASLYQVALLTPSPLRSGLKASLETLDFLVGYAGSWVRGLGNKWTPSRGSRSTRVLGTWVWGQGLILVSVCVPGDIWRTDDRSQGLVAVLSSVTG